jgi:formate dehydrogenase subunit gamma
MFFYSAGYSGVHVIVDIHMAAAVVFIAVPLVYYFLEPKTTAGFIRETFHWGKEDLKWTLAAPGYYFGGAADKMPPQGHVNAGQKLWQSLIIITGLLFVFTGAVLWFFRLTIPVKAYQWVLLVHGSLFVIMFVMLLVHIYLGVFHPRFSEAFRAILDGKISPSYARAHYPLWFEKKPAADRRITLSKTHSRPR